MGVAIILWLKDKVGHGVGAPEYVQDLGPMGSLTGDRKSYKVLTTESAWQSFGCV